jgi:hypothetical protein
MVVGMTGDQFGTDATIVPSCHCEERLPPANLSTSFDRIASLIESFYQAAMELPRNVKMAEGLA